MSFPRPRKTESEDELYQYAVGALGRRMRSTAELKRLLRRRVEGESEYGQTLIELVIRRLKDQGYLNDSQYAAAYSSLRRDNQKLGRMRVVTELKTRGVHGDVIEKAVEAAYEGVNEEKQAREYLRKRGLEKRKVQGKWAASFVCAQDADSTSKEKTTHTNPVKKAAKTTAKDTEKAADKTASATEKAAKKTGHVTKSAAKTTAKDTEKGAKATAKGTEKAADKTATAT